jgi:predicted RND superfamily exporter protein
VLRHRWLVLGLILLVTALAGFSISQGILTHDIGQMFFGDSPKFRSYLNRVEKFAPDVFLVVAYEEPAPLSVDSLDRLERIEKRVLAIPEVTRVESLLGAFSLKRLNKYALAARQNPLEAEALTREMAADPIVGGLLVSKDGRHAAIIVEFSPEAPENMLRARKVLAVFHDEGIPKEKIHPVGFPAVAVESARQGTMNLYTLFPLSAALLFAVVFLLFRRLAPAVVSLGVAGLAVTWTMGFYILLDRQVSLLATSVPLVILVVSFSDVIHLWSAYLVELAAGKQREEALLSSATEVGKACLLTSATTFVGFVCLSFVPTPIFQLLGVVLGFGVAIALLLAMTVVPIVISFLRPPPVPAGSRAHSLLDRVLAGIARISLKRPGWVAAGSAVVILVAVFGITQLNFETDLLKRLSYDNPVRADQRYYEQHFHGTNALEVFVDLPEKEALHDPELLGKVMAFGESIRTLDEVDYVISILDIVSLLHRTVSGADGPPLTRESLQRYFKLMEAFSGKDLKRVIDRTGGTIRLAVRMNVGGVRESNRVAVAVEALARDTVADAAKVEVTGASRLVGWWLDELLAGQRKGLVLTFVLITFMMIAGLRSLRMGLGSMIPNVLPLLAIAGYLGLAWDQVDSDTLGIGMMAIGIGVDDTIHFLMRYKIECSRSKNSIEALQRTFAFAGRAIVMTTIILVIGFLPLALSGYLSISIVGTLLPAVLIVALAADLLTVPAMVRLGWIDFAKRERTTAEPETGICPGEAENLSHQTS